MTAPTLVQNQPVVEEIRTLYLRFKRPFTLGNVVIVMPVDPASRTRILWVTDTAHNSWVREGVFWWATVTGWTPDVTVGRRHRRRPCHRSERRG